MGPDFDLEAVRTIPAGARQFRTRLGGGLATLTSRGESEEDFLGKDHLGSTLRSLKCIYKSVKESLEAFNAFIKSF